MRLKILFFPIILVAVIYVSIAYTWPEYQLGVQAQSALEQKRKSLDEVKSKKANIGSLRGSLDQNPEKETAILSYLSDSKQEEKIINAIDRIATGAGVSLVNLSVMSVKPTIVAPPPIENSPSLLGSAEQSNNGAITNILPPEVKPELMFVESKINVAGEYEYIKNFIDQLNGIGIYSTIDSVVIERQKAENAETQTTALVAEVVVKFAYLSKIENKRSLEGVIDLSVADSIAKLVAGTPAAPNADSLGKSNPFLP